MLINLWKSDSIVIDPDTQKKFPKGIYYYRKWLGSVDHYDRWLNLYFNDHRKMKWTQALLNGLLKIAINNTFIIAKYFDSKLTLKKTILCIIKHLSGNHTVKSARYTSPSSGPADTQNHFPESQFCAFTAYSMASEAIQSITVLVVIRHYTQNVGNLLIQNKEKWLSHVCVNCLAEGYAYYFRLLIQL